MLTEAFANQALWEAFYANPKDIAIRNQIVERYQSWLRGRALEAQRTGSRLSFSELLSIGNLAFLKALNDYKGDRGASALTYARVCVLGQMRTGHSPRERVTKSLRAKLHRRIRNLEHVAGRRLSRAEKAAGLGMSELEFAAAEERANRFNVEMPEFEDGHQLVETVVANPEVNDARIAAEVIRPAIDRLDPGDRELIEAVYYRGKTLTDLSYDIGTSKARQSQRHCRALKRLKTLIGRDPRKVA